MLCKQLPLGIRQIGGLTALSLIIGLSGCGTTSQTQSASPSPATFAASSTSTSTGKRPLVVASNTVVCDVTRQIAGETINLKCLIDAGADPHEYQPKPEDSKAIEQAKLILFGGYNFEPQVIKLIKATSNPAPKVAVNEAAVPKPQQFEEDGKTETDPHVFHSAANGVQIAKVINKNLSQLEPSHIKSG